MKKNRIKLGAHSLGSIYSIDGISFSDMIEYMEEFKSRYPQGEIFEFQEEGDVLVLAALKLETDEEYNQRIKTEQLTQELKRKQKIAQLEDELQKLKGN